MASSPAILALTVILWGVIPAVLVVLTIYWRSRETIDQLLLRIQRLEREIDAIRGNSADHGSNPQADSQHRQRDTDDMALST